MVVFCFLNRRDEICGARESKIRGEKNEAAFQFFISSLRALKIYRLGTFQTSLITNRNLFWLKRIHEVLWYHFFKNFCKSSSQIRVLDRVLSIFVHFKPMIVMKNRKSTFCKEFKKKIFHSDRILKILEKIRVFHWSKIVNYDS